MGPKKRKRSKFVVEEEAKIEKIKSNGLLSKSTRDRRRYHQNKMDEYCMLKKEKSFEDVILAATETGNITELQELLMGFFASFKVEDVKNQDPGADPISPMTNTALGYKTSLSKIIISISGGKVDLCNDVIFEEFHVSAFE